MVVHRHEELTTLRHLPSWALLAFSAGAVNAAALLACQRFVAHVTGTVTRIGVDAREVLALDYLLVLAAFIAGAAAAILFARKAGDAARPSYWAPLVLVSFLLTTVGLAGHAGWFGAFGGSVETARDFALLAILSFAMGMQNAAVAASTGMAVRTTHMTGPATDIGVALAMLASGGADERASARRSLLLRGTKLFAFVLGGVAAAALAPRFGFLVFVVPAATALVATAQSFAPWRAGAADTASSS